MSKIILSILFISLFFCIACFDISFAQPQNTIKSKGLWPTNPEFKESVEYFYDNVDACGKKARIASINFRHMVKNSRRFAIALDEYADHCFGLLMIMKDEFEYLETRPMSTSKLPIEPTFDPGELGLPPFIPEWPQDEELNKPLESFFEGIDDTGAKARCFSFNSKAFIKDSNNFCIVLDKYSNYCSDILDKFSYEFGFLTTHPRKTFKKNDINISNAPSIFPFFIPFSSNQNTSSNNTYDIVLKDIYCIKRHDGEFPLISSDPEDEIYATIFGYISNTQKLPFDVIGRGENHDMDIWEINEGGHRTINELLARINVPKEGSSRITIQIRESDGFDYTSMFQTVASAVSLALGASAATAGSVTEAAGAVGNLIDNKDPIVGVINLTLSQGDGGAINEKWEPGIYVTSVTKINQGICALMNGNGTEYKIIFAP